MNKIQQNRMFVSVIWTMPNSDNDDVRTPEQVSREDIKNSFFSTDGIWTNLRLKWHKTRSRKKCPHPIIGLFHEKFQLPWFTLVADQCFEMGTKCKLRNQMPVNRIKFYHIVIYSINFLHHQLNQKDNVIKSRHGLSVCLKTFRSMYYSFALHLQILHGKFLETNKNRDADEIQWHPHLLLHNGI